MLDISERLLSAPSTAEIWGIFSGDLADRGFEFVFYAARPFIDVPTLRRDAELDIYTSYPADFMDEMVGGGHLMHSPWVRWSYENRGATGADFIHRPEAAPYRGRKAMDAVACAERHGVANGHIISLHRLSARVHGALALTPHRGAPQVTSDDLWAEHGREILVLASLMHLRLGTMPRVACEDGLTPRQRQVLEWISGGRTVAEVAAILGVTPATVEKHLRLARESLGVGTTAQAILKAHLRNQIFVQGTAPESDPAPPMTKTQD